MTLRHRLTEALRRWLLGPALNAQIEETVQRLAALGRQADAQAAAAAAPNISPTSSPASSLASWYALPGHRIELDDTGFQIAMRLGDRAFSFVLITPEGLEFAEGVNLESLKQLAERMASHRREFSTDNPRPYAPPRTH